MNRLLIAIAAMLVAGCNNTKPDVPRGVIVQPKAIDVVRKEYVQVPPELTDQLPIAEGPLAYCPDVAAARKETLKRANSDRAKTRALSGTKAKP